MQQVKKILVIQTAFIGDAILASALLEHLHKQLPEATIDLLVRSGNEQLYAAHPFLRNVLVWQKKEAKYKNLLKLMKTVRSNQYDLVLNLQRHTASALITVLAGAKATAGFDSTFLSRFYSHRTNHVIGKKGQPDYKHEIDRCIELAKPWVPFERTLPKLYPTAQDFSFNEQYSTKPFITISPSSVWMTKQVPMHVWSNFICAVSGYEVFLLGGPGDVELCRSLAQQLPHVHVLAGKLTLLQSAALMSKAHMNYTNDSAPMHLCSSLNAPVTAVFCSTIPEFGFGPLSTVSSVVQVSENLSCKPCGVHGFSSCPARHFKCGNIETNQLLNTLPK
jgi:ADP-heptose:LPS heptosyltransferase